MSQAIPFNTSTDTEGAVLLEWTKGRKRLGVSLEVIPEDSSWYYISFEPGKERAEAGALNTLDFPSLYLRLANG